MKFIGVHSEQHCHFETVVKWCGNFSRHGVILTPVTDVTGVRIPRIKSKTERKQRQGRQPAARKRPFLGDLSVHLVGTLANVPNFRLFPGKTQLINRGPVSFHGERNGRAAGSPPLLLLSGRYSIHPGDSHASLRDWLGMIPHWNSPLSRAARRQIPISRRTHLHFNTTT